MNHEHGIEHMQAQMMHLTLRADRYRLAWRSARRGRRVLWGLLAYLNDDTRAQS